MSPQNQIQFIKDYYLVLPVKIISAAIGRSDTFVKNEMKRQGIVVPREIVEGFIKDSQFKEGFVPVNKGKKQVEYMSKIGIANSSKTRFKKGNLPVNTLYDGAISKRKDSNGYWYYHIRISKANWELLHRFIWELDFGPIPKGYNVQFKDGDTLNCDPSNLYVMSRSEQAQVNKKGGNKLPYQLRRTIGLIQKLNNKINEK